MRSGRVEADGVAETVDVAGDASLARAGVDRKTARRLSTGRPGSGPDPRRRPGGLGR